MVPLWVSDALDEGEEYGEEGEEEGEAAADVGVEVATEEGRSVDVSDAEDAFAAEKNGFNKVKTRADEKNSRSSLKTGDWAVEPKLSVIRRMKCEAEVIFGADLSK